MRNRRRLARQCQDAALWFAASKMGESVTYQDMFDIRVADLDVSPDEYVTPCNDPVIVTRDEDPVSFGRNSASRNTGNTTAYLSHPMSRIIDIVGALLLLVMAFPVLVLLAIALQLDSPGRLFFVQQRVGKDGRLFACLKFRTMCEGAEAELERHLAQSEAARKEWATTFKLQDDPRVTTLGRIVRKHSLDEFPQLINILLGEMSLVGPRPIVEDEILLYGRYYADYCKVRPGLTGLWQVSGRNDTSYRRRVSIDSLYVRRKSVALDLAIIARTVPAVIGARGSY